MKLRITVEGVKYDVEVEVLDGTVATAPAATHGAQTAASAPAPAGTGGAVVPSPIAGVIMEVRVKPGDTVAENDTLLVMEAMKMETNVASPYAGRVREVLVKAGDSVTAGQPLVRFA